MKRSDELCLLVNCASKISTIKLKDNHIKGFFSPTINIRQYANTTFSIMEWSIGVFGIVMDLIKKELNYLFCFLKLSITSKSIKIIN